MKRIELLFSAILVPVDYLMIVLAGFVAFTLRFGSPVTSVLRPASDELAIETFLSAMLLVALGWLLIFALSGLYAIRGTKRMLDEFTSIFLACSTSITAVIILFFFQRELFSSRFIILSGWILAVLFVTVGRLIVRRVQHSLLARGIGVYRVALIGHDQTTAYLAELFRQRPTLGYRVVVQYPTADEAILKDLDERFFRASESENNGARGIDVILQADPVLSREQTQLLLDYANDRHVTFRYAADLFNAQATNIAVETYAGVPIIEMRRTRLDGWGRIVKRAFDLVFAAAALIVFAPLFLITALFIRADTPGPVFVRLTRVGERGKLFDVFKFRSMVENAHALKPQLMVFNERSGPLFKMKNDPRITRVGRFLRRSSIDELPQLINIMRGEMSLVGPRPHEPEEVSKYDRHHKKLLTIKPGITGLAQVSGRSDLEFEEEARLDIFYIEHWSVWIDLSVLFRTPLVVLRMKSVA